MKLIHNNFNRMTIVVMWIVLALSGCDANNTASKEGAPLEPESMEDMNFPYILLEGINGKEQRLSLIRNDQEWIDAEYLGDPLYVQKLDSAARSRHVRNPNWIVLRRDYEAFLKIANEQVNQFYWAPIKIVWSASQIEEGHALLSELSSTRPKGNWIYMSGMTTRQDYVRLDGSGRSEYVLLDFDSGGFGENNGVGKGVRNRF